MTAVVVWAVAASVLTLTALGGIGIALWIGRRLSGRVLDAVRAQAFTAGKRTEQVEQRDRQRTSADELLAGMRRTPINERPPTHRQEV